MCDETRINLSGAVFGTDETTEKNEKMGYFPGKAEHHCNTDFELVNIVLRISKITIPWFFSRKLGASEGTINQEIQRYQQLESVAVNDIRRDVRKKLRRSSMRVSRMNWLQKFHSTCIAYFIFWKKKRLKKKRLRKRLRISNNIGALLAIGGGGKGCFLPYNNRDRKMEILQVL